MHQHRTLDIAEPHRLRRRSSGRRGVLPMSCCGSVTTSGASAVAPHLHGSRYRRRPMIAPGAIARVSAGSFDAIDEPAVTRCRAAAGSPAGAETKAETRPLRRSIVEPVDRRSRRGASAGTTRREGRDCRAASSASADRLGAAAIAVIICCAIASAPMSRLARTTATWSKDERGVQSSRCSRATAASQSAPIGDAHARRRRRRDGIVGVRAGAGEEVAETDDARRSTVTAGRSVWPAKRGGRRRARRRE